MVQNSGKGRHSQVAHFRRGKASPSKPTAFLCIRLASQELKALAKELQQLLVEQQPALSNACTPSGWQHLTLFVMTLQTDHEYSTAKRILKEAEGELKQLFATHGTPQLQVQGLAEMNGQVAAFSVKNDAVLGSVREAIHLLHKRFSAAGLTQQAAEALSRGRGWRGDAAEQEIEADAAAAAAAWTPHSTFMKLSTLRFNLRRLRQQAKHTQQHKPPKRIDFSNFETVHPVEVA